MNSKLSRRQILIALGLGAGTVAAGGLSACAPSGGSNGEGTAGNAGDDVDRSGDSFTFAAWSLNEEASQPVIQGVLDEYAEDNGVTIDTVAYPYAEYLNQLTLQMRGDQFTGAAQLDIAWLGAIASTGKLRDLSAYVEGAGYTESALASGQFEGKQLGLPWTTGAIGLIGNRQMLEAAGVSPEFATIDEFEAGLRALKAAQPDVTPYGAMTAVDGLKDVLAWMMTFGSPLVSDGEVTIGDEPSVEAVAWYKKLYDAELIPPALNRFDARALFAQGQLAMYEDAIVAKGAVASQAPEGFGDLLVPIARPAPAGGTPRSMLWGHLVVVVDGGASDAAAELARHITSDTDVVVDYFEALSLPPTTEEALAATEVVQDEYTVLFTERITVNAGPNPFWAYPNYAQMEAAVAERIQAVLVNDESPADAMKAAGEEIQELIG